MSNLPETLEARSLQSEDGARKGSREWSADHKHSLLSPGPQGSAPTTHPAGDTTDDSRPGEEKWQVVEALPSLSRLHEHRDPGSLEGGRQSHGKNLGPGCQSGESTR